MPHAHFSLVVKFDPDGLLTICAAFDLARWFGHWSWLDFQSKISCSMFDFLLQSHYAQDLPLQPGAATQAACGTGAYNVLKNGKEEITLIIDPIH